RKQHEVATLPEVLQAQEESARATYELQDALAAEHDARMALLESIGVRPGTPIDIADISQEPLPAGLEESVDEAIDRALAQRPDLIAGLAESTQRQATADLERATDKAVREVWKAYNDTKVALAKHEAAAALLTASEKAWDATLDSYRNGLSTF